MKGSLQLPKSKRERCLWHAACCSSHYKFMGKFPTSNRELNPNILLSERLEQPLIRLLIGLSLCFNICHLRKPTAVPKWAFLDIIRSLWKGTVLNSVINVWYYCLPNLANGFSGDLYLSNYHLQDKCLWGMHYAQTCLDLILLMRACPIFSKTPLLKQWSNFYITATAALYWLSSCHLDSFYQLRIPFHLGSVLCDGSPEQWPMTMLDFLSHDMWTNLQMQVIS